MGLGPIAAIIGAMGPDAVLHLNDQLQCLNLTAHQLINSQPGLNMFAEGIPMDKCISVKELLFGSLMVIFLGPSGPTADRAR